MEEEADRVVNSEAPQFLGEGEEMIVVHPHQRVRPQKCPQPARHHPIDLAIGRVVVLIRADKIGARVQDRP